MKHWVKRIHLDTTSSSASSGWESDVTVLTPVSSPWVLDGEVVQALIVAITYCEYSVVQLVTTAMVKDTRFVHRESTAASINRNSDRLLSQSLLKSVDWSRSDWLILFDWYLLLGGLGLILARAILCLVGVITLKGGVVSFGVVIESLFLSATVTSTCNVENAINELLLWERQQLTRFDSPGTFQSTSCGESPAWATITLILGRSDSTLANPVYTSVPVRNTAVGNLLFSFSNLNILRCSSETE